MFCLVYLGIQSSVVVTFGLSLEANLNAGIVTTIWAVTPLYGAVLDYLFFGQRLTTRHIIGVITLIACAASISLANVIGVESTGGDKPIREPTVKGWIPVVIAVFTPLLFVSQGLITKHLCAERGFDAYKL